MVGVVALRPSDNCHLADKVFLIKNISNGRINNNFKGLLTVDCWMKLEACVGSLRRVPCPVLSPSRYRS
jgi:hypothetical protein